MLSPIFTRISAIPLVRSRRRCSRRLQLFGGAAARRQPSAARWFSGFDRRRSDCRLRHLRRGVGRGHSRCHSNKKRGSSRRARFNDCRTVLLAFVSQIVPRFGWVH